MVARRSAVALLVVLVAPAAGAQTLRTLAPAQMEEDLFALSEALTRDHPGLHRYTSEEELDEAFGEALFSLSEEASTLELYRTVASLVSLVRCGHTRATISSLDREEVLARRGVLPFEVHLVGDRAWVLSVIGEGVPLTPGQEIAAIDGVPFPEVRERAFAGLFDDGFIETAKERALEARFGELYALLVDDGESGDRRHTVRVAGVEEPLEVRGLTPQDYAARPPRAAPRPFMSLEFPAEGVGWLYVQGFGDPAGEPPFPRQLEECFLRLEREGAAHLILDLRGNGGGRDMYGALLVSYLADRPFGYFDHIEVTADYEGEGGIVEKDGMRLVTAHDGLKIQQPAEHRFEGDVYVLTDGWTFSTAADVATVAHYNGFATFIGEETGGGYDGNTSGSSYQLTLPHSGITVSVPRWMYTTANVGHACFGRGVIPDHPVRPSIEDALAGRDAGLELALELIRGG